MTKIRKIRAPIASLLLPFSLMACVTTHASNQILSTPAAVSMSCAIDRRITNSKVKAIQLTLENTTEGWVEYQVNPESMKSDSIRVLDPKDTAAFHEAYALKAAQDDINTQLFLGSLVLIGAAGMSSGHTANIGSAAVVGGTVGGAVYEVGKATNAVQYGSSNLLGDPFRIPPDLFLRKSFLVQSELWEKSQSLRFCLKGSDESCFKLAIVPLFSKDGFDRPVVTDDFLCSLNESA